MLAKACRETQRVVINSLVVVLRSELLQIPHAKRIPRGLFHREERSCLARRRILDAGFPSPAPASSSSSADNRRVRSRCWTDAEVKALVEFILFHFSGSKWPSDHQMDFWEAAASFIKSRAQAKDEESGKAYHLI